MAWYLVKKTYNFTLVVEFQVHFVFMSRQELLSTFTWGVKNLLLLQTIPTFKI